ncbi:MAG: hypothetical protein JO214_03555 [Frankiaceae bacterium]|nr:hypothetical protein [Frankiaceae bacterium]
MADESPNPHTPNGVSARREDVPDTRQEIDCAHWFGEWPNYKANPRTTLFGVPDFPEAFAESGVTESQTTSPAA